MQTYCTDSKQQLLFLCGCFCTPKSVRFETFSSSDIKAFTSVTWSPHSRLHFSVVLFQLAQPTRPRQFCSHPNCGCSKLKEECKLDWNSMTCALKAENSDKGRATLLRSQQCLQSSSIVLQYCQMQSHIGVFTGISSAWGICNGPVPGCTVK